MPGLSRVLCPTLLPKGRVTSPGHVLPRHLAGPGQQWGLGSPGAGAPGQAGISSSRLEPSHRGRVTAGEGEGASLLLPRLHWGN